MKIYKVHGYYKSMQSINFYLKLHNYVLFDSTFLRYVVLSTASELHNITKLFR